MVPVQDIDRFRAFNRFLSREIGLIDRVFLDTGRTLAELRVLFEIGQRPRTARGLARELGLDEGYLSRILKGFRGDGWLKTAPDPQDRRKTILSLTQAGQGALAGYIERSRSQVGARLSDVADGERSLVQDALGTLRQAMGDGTLAHDPVQMRDAEPSDLGWLIDRHTHLYAAEHDFDDSFTLLVSEILTAFFRTRDRGLERAWIPERAGVRLGSIFCMKGAQEGDAQLRLFWLEPSARGGGIARQMLDACIGFARDAGYRRLALWTHESHEAAGRLYQRAGFRMTGSEPALNFGQDVVQQSWVLELRDGVEI